MQALVHDPDIAVVAPARGGARPGPRSGRGADRRRRGSRSTSSTSPTPTPSTGSARYRVRTPPASSSRPRPTAPGRRRARASPPSRWAGRWPRRRAVATADLGVVPDGVDLVTAAALPAAGVTALRAVRRLGSLLGRRVLVTGASGGVGRYAVQLAALAGAHVVAQVGSAGRGAGLSTLGAAEVVTDLAGVAPVHGVVENVGGSLLAATVALLADGGVALSVGQASGQPSTIDFEAERQRGGHRAVEVFTVGTGYAGFGDDIEELLGLVAAGRLDPQIGWRGSVGPGRRGGRGAARPAGGRQGGRRDRGAVRWNSAIQGLNSISRFDATLPAGPAGRGAGLRVVVGAGPRRAPDDGRFADRPGHPDRRPDRASRPRRRGHQPDDARHRRDHPPATQPGGAGEAGREPGRR